MADQRKKRKYCDHCNEYIDQRTFRDHRKTYYDAVTKTWQKNSNNISDDKSINFQITEVNQAPSDEEDDSSANFGGNSSSNAYRDSKTINGIFYII